MREQLRKIEESFFAQKKTPARALNLHDRNCKKFLNSKTQKIKTSEPTTGRRRRRRRRRRRKSSNKTEKKKLQRRLG
jgi:hypothetical protein